MNPFGGIYDMEEWLISPKPASTSKVMFFFHSFFPRFLNNGRRERDRSARILPLSSFQPMLMWRGVAGS